MQNRQIRCRSGWYGLIEQNVRVRLYTQRARESFVRARRFEFHGLADFVKRRVLLALAKQKVAVAPANIRGERIHALRGQKCFARARCVRLVWLSRRLRDRRSAERAQSDTQPEPQPATQRKKP